MYNTYYLKNGICLVYEKMPHLKTVSVGIWVKSGSMYEAALDLGATPTQALFKVVLPEILSGVFSGFMLAITLSLDDYIITATLAPLGYDTISTAVYKAIALTTEKASEKVPIYRALTTIIFLITVAVVVVMNIRAGKNSAKRKV